ncbi:MAG TPA: alpha/beta family hydrolase [Anaerolineales bacterium]
MIYTASMLAASSLKFAATPEQGKVSALLLKPPDAVALLVLAHGAGTDMRHRSLETLSNALAEFQLATFRYNFPYMEGRRGRISPKPLLTATVRAAVAAAAKAAPGLPICAGGRSMGGRMTSLAASQAPLAGVRGLVFFAFPLHPAGKPGTERAEHLFEVDLPMLFLQGPRDDLATPELLAPIIKRLGPRATLHTVAGADHSFKVLKSSGRTEAEVLRELAETTAGWISTKL